MKELIIIGGGPAGITAAIYAARKKMDFSLITYNIGGQTIWSGDVENYTGQQFISGPELAIKFKEHLDQFKFDLLEGVSVKQVEKKDDYFVVVTDKGDKFETKTLIIASGKFPKMLGVKGEGKYKGKGLTYCATCDGPMFPDKHVAVIGGGNSGLDAALQMTKIATKTYLINVGPELTGDKIMQDKVKALKNVEIINQAKVVEIFGEQFLTGLKYEQAGEVKTIAVQGVFVEIGLKPNNAFINFVKKNELGEILINCATETNIPGLFAAGDVTDVPAKQIIVAAGDGAKATMAAFMYLSTH